MKRLAAVILACSLTGCVTSYNVERGQEALWLPEAQHSLAQEEATIIFRDGSSAKGILVAFTKDSVAIQSNPIVVESYTLDSIHSVGTSGNAGGPIFGGVVGLFAGGWLGASLGASSERGFDRIGAGFGGGIIGGVVGTLVGAGIGGQLTKGYHYTITPKRVRATK